jgi:hypothetical protein
MSSKFWENKSGNPKIWMKLSYETRPTDKTKIYEATSNGHHNSDLNIFGV